MSAMSIRQEPRVQMKVLARGLVCTDAEKKEENIFEIPPPVPDNETKKRASEPYQALLAYSIGGVKF